MAEASVEPLDLVAAEAHDLGERVGGLGSGGGLGGQPLERVVLRGVVLAQAEQPGDGLGAEPRRRREAGGLGALGERLRVGGQPERRDEPGVEVLDRERDAGLGDRRRSGGRRRGERARRARPG